MKRSFLIIALTLAQSITTPALSEPLTPQEQAMELTGQAKKKLMQALQLMILHIPQYEAPIINEHGDIIIKRKSPQKPGANKKSKDGPGHNI
jgi:hypothetical protein